MTSAQEPLPEAKMEQLPPSTTDTTLRELRKYRMHAGFPYEFEAPNHEDALREVARLLNIDYPLDLKSFFSAKGISVFCLTPREKIYPKK